MKNKIFAAIFIFFLSITFGCGGKAGPEKNKAERVRVTGVTIEELLPIEVSDYYETTGTVRSRNVSLVSAKIMGEVKEIKVNVSDKVKKGEILLIISSPDIEAKVKTAQEALAESEKGLRIAEENSKLTEKTYERYKRLFEEKAISGQEFDEISTKREVALLQYELALKTLKRAEAAKTEGEAFEGYSVIKSPVTGIVAEKMIDKGSMTVPGTTLLIIEEPVYRVEVPVNEKMFSSVAANEEALIFIEALDLNTTGSIGEIVHQVDPVTRTFSVKIDLKERVGSLRSGFYAKVKFPIGKISSLFVRKSAVVQRGELKGVYVVNKDGIVAYRLVKTGKQDGDKVEILSGLTAGERIIITGTDKAVDGGAIANNE